MATVPAGLREVLESALRELGFESALPKKLRVGKLVVLTAPSRQVALLPRADGADCLVTSVARWHPGNDEFEVFSHYRIHSDGRIEPLENLEGQYGIMPGSSDPAEKERLRNRVFAHNERVWAILYRKGLSYSPYPAFLSLGGFPPPEPSDSLDPGEWLAIADEHASRPDGSPGDLELARHAVEQVIHFLPDGADRVPDEAFRTPRGCHMRDAGPSRFRRVHLLGMLDAYVGPST